MAEPAEPVAPTVRPAGKRLFVGVAVSMKTVDDLAGAAEALARRAQQSGVAIRWLAPATYHVTLKFLGWCDDETVPAVVAAVRAALAGEPGMRFTTARLGAFPSAARASVVWAGVDDGGRLAGLAAKLDDALAPLGFPREARRFHPHVTIARLNAPADVGTVLLPLSEQVFSETRSEDVIVFESVKKSNGSEYASVARIGLGGSKLS